MNGLKKLIKSILPSSLLRPVLSAFHFIQGIAAALWHGLPSRKLNTIMITGTNGKTTTIGYLVEILEAAGLKVGVNSTAFYKVGDWYQLNDTNTTVDNPFMIQAFLRKLRGHHVDVAIIETTSHALVQHRLWGVKPTVASMTNLTQDHLDYHGTMENYAAAKAKLFKRKPEHVVLNADDEWYDYYANFTGTESTISYGASEQATVAIKKANLSKTGSTVTVKFNNQLYEIKTGLLGKFNVYNALNAACIALTLGIDMGVVSRGVAALRNVPGRLQSVENNKGLNVLIDYAHTPDALSNTLDTLKNVTAGRLICVYGATGDRDAGKRPEMGRIVADLADVSVITDDEPYGEDPTSIRMEVVEGAKQSISGNKVLEIGDRRLAIEEAIRQAVPGDTVVLAGIGHQQFRVMGPNGRKEAWSEEQVALDFLH